MCFGEPRGAELSMEPNYNGEEQCSVSSANKTEKNCGIYDPACDNKVILPSISTNQSPLSGKSSIKGGFLVSVGVASDGRFCINIGSHAGLPSPAIHSGDLLEK